MSVILATIRLLEASIFIALSGAFRIYIAYLLGGNDINISNIIAGSLIIYAVYTFDRTKGGEEDSINRKELTDARKDVGFFICLLTSLAGAVMLLLNHINLIIFIPFITGYCYNKRISIGKFSFKLKGGMGMKNLIVAISWGIFITGIAMNDDTDLFKTVLIFSFVFVKTYINTVMNDFSDIKGDKASGLMTLPICLGEQKTRILLILVHLLEHGLIIFSMVSGILEFEFIIVFSCFFSGIIYIFLFAKSIDIMGFRVMNILYYFSYRWEFYVAVGLKTVYLNFV